MLTKREVFKKVKAHLLNQNKRSRNENGLCAYRGENGAMCAVGCLIDDAQYHPRLENRECSHPAMMIALLNSGVPTDCNKMLEELQGMHDTAYVNKWSYRLDDIECIYFGDTK